MISISAPDELSAYLLAARLAEKQPTMFRSERGWEVQIQGSGGPELFGELLNAVQAWLEHERIAETALIVDGEVHTVPRRRSGA